MSSNIFIWYFQFEIIGKKEGVRVEGRKEKGKDLRLNNRNEKPITRKVIQKESSMFHVAKTLKAQIIASCRSDAE